MNRPPKINPKHVCEEVSNYIEEKRKKLNRNGVIIGLSGGLDSEVTAYLAIQGVGKDRVSLLYLPDRDSKIVHQRDAHLISKKLDVPLKDENISPI